MRGSGNLLDTRFNLGLRYIPILHGGDLPGRLKRSPEASRALFAGAYVNVAPSKFLIQNSAFCTLHSI